MSLNSYILGKFTRGKNLSTDAKLLPVHFQILSIFYLNFALTLLLIMFEGGTLIFLKLPVDRFLTGVSILGSIISILMLKIGYYEVAGIIVLFYVHLVDYFTMYVLNMPMAGIFGILCYINLSYFVTTSKWVILLNGVASFVEVSLHVKEIMTIFEVVLTEEQAFQLRGGVVPIFVAFFYMSALAAIQQLIYSSLCNQAIVNYERSEDLTREVVKTVEVKDKFISSLSHEVRNVLNALNGSVDNLLKVVEESTYKQLLKNAKLSAEILFNLVNNALDGAKIKDDKIELNYSNVNFEDVVKKTLIINSESLKGKNIFAQALIANNLPAQLRIDSGRLLQILINLVSNAIKFTPKDGQIRIHVSWFDDEQDSATLFHLIKDRDNEEEESFVSTDSPRAADNSIVYQEESSEKFNTSALLEFSTEEETKHQKNLVALGRLPSFNKKGAIRSHHLIHNSEQWIMKKVKPDHRPVRHQDDPHVKKDFGYLKVQVSDTGCGISEQDITKLFKMYSRGDCRISGTGLGLWICKQLCMKMGGDISVRSSVGQGSDFVFYIPVHKVQETAVAMTEIKSPRNQDKINALVVDDFEFNRNLHKLLLEREGVQVTLACDGKEALEKYKEKGDKYFNLIFMDINMPEMDGITSAKKIREWEEENGFGLTSIYFISGDYFNESEVLAGFKTNGNNKKANYIRFMRKPVELFMITKIVEKHQLGEKK